MEIEPIVLTGKVVRLIPLDRSYIQDLAAVGQVEDIWKYMRYGPIDTLEKMSEFVDYLLTLQERKTDLPFAVFYQSSGQAIGMTRYMDIQPVNRSLEIGGTWYGKDFQHTAVNTECKFLLLQHAFESLNCLRVQFKADVRNERSQRALERIGGIKEGILRDHIILPDGTVRSSVYYSILAREWPEARQHLIKLLNR
ncbi:MAG: GNAT family protein [Anaerolineaceae bacterium]|nr:GNAT family protein [Anaerolineaceae bacterium]